MTVLVAPDKFKGSLTADQVAVAVAEGLAEAGVAARCLPLADGGDGSVAAAVAAGFAARSVAVHGATGQVHDSTYALKQEVAVVEVADTCGLATLPAGILAPMTASTTGFGQAVRRAVQDGADTIVLALGGSASTDGGAGMLAALGARFLSQDGQELSPTGENLIQVAAVDITALDDLSGVHLVVAADVHNPLLGPEGAAATFGPQKGATAGEVERLEAGLAHLAALLERTPPPWVDQPLLELSDLPGTGAAGGVGFACLWLGASRVAGADYFLDLLGFDSAVAGCRAVITGEGSIDGQTIAGKLPSVVAARSAPRPVYAVVGRAQLSDDERLALGIEEIVALASMTPHDSSRDPLLSMELAKTAGRRLGQLIAGDQRASSEQGESAPGSADYACAGVEEDNGL